MARDVVAEIRERKALLMEYSGRHALALYEDERDLLLAVVEAAKEVSSATTMSTDASSAQHARLRDALARLYAGSSGETDAA